MKQMRRQEPKDPSLSSNRFEAKSRSQKLDLTNVGPRFLPPNYDFGTRTKRMFGLPEAMTFRPTVEEFADPLKYIKSIRQVGEKYGVCRIVPPKGWKPPFGLDTETFRFKTRYQKLNSMEGESRSILNYLDQLQKFHTQQQTPFTRVPVLDKKPVDLYHLKKEVARRGGYHVVTESKKWAEVGRAIGNTSKTCTSMSTSVRNIYVRWILPYEEYIEKNATVSMNSAAKEHTGSRSSKRKKMSKFTRSRPQIPEHEHGELCELCGGNENTLIICSDCEAGFHGRCLEPPMKSRPTSDWSCPNCLKVSGNDYGFEEGKERTLHSFQKYANEFKSNWFSSRKSADGKVQVTEDEVEREFWRLVESPYEDVEVEYGADLHSSHHGSGFPTAEKDPLNEYSKCGWNLNNIALLPESLFCNIHNDISGMMIPWLYVGMVFSTFCWHTEDHYTYSVNYHHWGETKTWYGIPSSSAEKFEKTMREKVPELFESNPDLLFHLTTILSPAALVKNGVEVFALDQRPGDIIITFPQSYHAGFNHGFNFCEAVNFALPDWLPYGLSCVERYQTYKKVPVFSHDELVVSTYRRDQSAETAEWLKRELDLIFERETNGRKILLEKFYNLQVVFDPKMDDEEHCFHCNSYCYISEFKCGSCSGDKISCLKHWTLLCSCQSPSPILRIRFTDDEIYAMCKEIGLKSSNAIDPNSLSSSMTSFNGNTPVPWRVEFRSIMRDMERPALSELKRIHAKGLMTCANITDHELRSLADFIQRADDWVNRANAVCDIEAARAKELHRTPEIVDKLLAELKSLPFNAPTVLRLKKLSGLLLETMEVIKVMLKVKIALGKPLTSNDKLIVFVCVDNGVVNLQELINTRKSMKETLASAQTARFDMPEMIALWSKIQEFDWVERVYTRFASTEVAMHQRLMSGKGFKQLDIQAMIDEGNAIGVKKEKNGLLLLLEQAKLRSDSWGLEAQKIMPMKSVKFEVLEKMMSRSDFIGVPTHLVLEIWNRYAMGIEFRQRANVVIECAKGAMELGTSWTERKPSAASVYQLLDEETRLPVNVPEVTDLKALHMISDDWITSGRNLLGNPSNSLVFTLREMWKNVDLCTKTTKADLCICHDENLELWKVECAQCRSKYHGKCLGLHEIPPVGFVCSACDVRSSFPQYKRPTIQQVHDFITNGNNLPITPEAELNLLHQIVNKTQNWIQHTSTFVQAISSKSTRSKSDVSKLRTQFKIAEGICIQCQPVLDQLRRLMNEVNVASMSKASNQQGGELFCLCRKPFDNERPMIACDFCEDWFHFSCVNLTQEVVSSIDKYACPRCRKSNGGLKRSMSFNGSYEAQKLQKLDSTDSYQTVPEQSACIYR